MSTFVNMMFLFTLQAFTVFDVISKHILFVLFLQVLFFSISHSEAPAKRFASCFQVLFFLIATHDSYLLKRGSIYSCSLVSVHVMPFLSAIKTGKVCAIFNIRTQVAAVCIASLSTSDNGPRSYSY